MPLIVLGRPWPLQLLYCATQDHSEGDGTAYDGLVPLPPGVSQDCPSLTCPTFQCDGGVFKIEIPFSQLTLPWVKLTNHYYFFLQIICLCECGCARTRAHTCGTARLSVLVSYYLSCPGCNSRCVRPGGFSVYSVI